MLELGLINREALWQMERCIYTCMRRWPHSGDASAVVERALWTWIHSCRTALERLQERSQGASADPVKNGG